MELESPDGGDKGVDAVSWLAHLGGEGGLHGGQLWHWLAALDLGHVVLSLAAQRQTGEWDCLDGHLGALGLAGWTALGDWDLGEAHLAWELLGQVPEDGATASGSLVSLGNLGWLDHDLGAHLSLLLELRHEVGWDGGGDGWDHPGSNLQLWLGHDALGSNSLGDDWLHEVAAQATQLVLQLDGWDDLNLLAIGPDLLEVEPWGLEDDDTVGGLLEGGDWLAGNVLDDDWLASGDASDWPVIDEDIGVLLDHNSVLLQVNNGFPLGAPNWHETVTPGNDTKPVEVGGIKGDGNAIRDGTDWQIGWDPKILTVELVHVEAADGTGLSGEDGARDKLVGGKPDVVPDGGEWEEEVVWVGDADVAEEDLLGWPDDLQVEAWGLLVERHLDGGLVAKRLELVRLDGAGGWAVVWVQVSLQEVDDLGLGNLEAPWDIDVLSLEDDLVQGGGLDADNLFELSNELGAGTGGPGGNQVPQLLGLGGHGAEGLLFLGGLGSASGDDLGGLSVGKSEGHLVLILKVDQGVADVLNVPHWEDWHGQLAGDGHLLQLGLWDLRLQHEVPLVVDLGRARVPGTVGSGQSVGEGPWAGRLQDQAGGQGQAGELALRDLGSLEVGHDLLQGLLATLVTVDGLQSLGHNLQWGDGRDQLLQGWVGLDLRDQLLREGGEGLLLQSVVLDGRLARDLGGSADLDLNADLLGGGLGWVQESGHLVVADGWGQVLGESWGSPSEDHHVDWVLVDLDELDEGPAVDVAGLSLDHGLESEAEEAAEGERSALPLGDGPDWLQGGGLGQGLELVDLSDGGVWLDVVVTDWDLTSDLGDWPDHNRQLLGWDVKLDLHGSWDVDDGVLVDSRDDELAGEWADGADVGRELGGQQGLSGDVDAWDHGQWLDGSLAQQGDGDWSVQLNLDWQAHVGWEHDLDWRQVDGLLEVDLHLGLAGQQGAWVLDELDNLLVDEPGSLLGDGAEEDAGLSHLAESVDGHDLGLDWLDVELLQDLGELGVKGTPDLRLEVLGDGAGGGLGDDRGQGVDDGVGTGHHETALEEVIVVLLEEESDADVSRPWHDLLVSGNPGELSPVARVQLPQELGLVEVGGSWDDSVGLPDNLVSGPGLQGQRRLWHLLEPLHGLVAEGVEADVDDLEELHVHLWLLPGDRGNGVEDVLWWVQLEDSVEGGDPHLSGLGWVGEHGQEDWGDQVWVVEAGVHQGVDGEDPGHLVPGALDGVERDGAGGAMGLDDWGQLSDDVLVAEEAKGDDVDVPDVLLSNGLWLLVEGPGQVWDQDLLDNLGLWGAELAEGVGWEGGLPVLGDAGGLHQLGQTGHGNRVGGWDPGDGLDLSDELEQAVEDLLGWEDDVAWQEHEESGDLGLWDLALADEPLEELEGVWGAGHDDSVEEQLLHGQSLFAGQAGENGGVEALNLLDGLEGSHAADSGQEHLVDLVVDLNVLLATDDQQNFLQDLGDLGDEFGLVWGGLRVESLEESPWDGLGQDLAVSELGPWDPALGEDLLGDGVGGDGWAAVSLLGVLVHHGLKGDWLGWLWHLAGWPDGLELEGLEGSGDKALGLGAHQLEVEFTVVDDGLDGHLARGGAAGNEPGGGGPGQHVADVVDGLGGALLHEVSWAVEGEGRLLLAVVEVHRADDLEVLVGWAGLWDWDQGWVLPDNVLWELVDLVGGQALAGNGLFHDLPVGLLTSGLDHVGVDTRLHLDLEEGDDALLQVDGPLWLALGDGDLGDLAGLTVQLDDDWERQDPLELLWDLHHLWQLDAPPVGAIVSGWNVVFSWFEDIVDLDKLWLGDDHAKGGWGPGNQGDSGVDAETRVLAVQGWESSHETARVLKGELLARLEPKATLTGQAGGSGKADNHEESEELHILPKG